jgi:anaerobic magnesium-protoporphyrin IX monomethyl ester cyclase
VKAVRTLSENGVIVLIGMMLGAPYENFRDMITTIRFSNKLADAGADAVQFSVYTPLPGTRIFDDALKNNKLFTVNWDRYDILTPVMKTKIHPVITQILQLYGHYSFYVTKYFKSRLGTQTTHVLKRDLLVNSRRFIFDMMPAYLRDFAGFPGRLWQTQKLYASGTRKAVISRERMSQLIEFSNKVVYLETGTSKNPYFLIREAAE